MFTFKKIFIFVLINFIIIFINSPLYAQLKILRCKQPKHEMAIQEPITKTLDRAMIIQEIERETLFLKLQEISLANGRSENHLFDSEIDTSIKLLQRHSWELGPELSYITYEEPGVMTEKGFMFGVRGSYTYHHQIMFRLDGRYSYGQVDYENSGTINNIDDYIIELRGGVGYDFKISKSSILTPYIGLGYRYLNDDSSGMISSTGAMGYERESNYFYCPIGITTLFLGNEWSYGLTLEYDLFLKGEQKTNLSDVNSSYNDPEVDQHNGYGVRGSIKFVKKDNIIQYIIEPFARYWNIKESDKENVTSSGSVVGQLFEPKNNSTEFGINVMIMF